MEGSGRPTTVALVGRTGNGKSATGNSIVGRKAFQCRSGSSAVRAGCELQEYEMKNGRKLNVIDTPGLFDPTVNLDFLRKEIVKCIDLAKDGLHGVLFVLSVRNRYTPEEAAALETLQRLFGNKILNYMVVIFTGGDELEANEETLDEYLRESPLELQGILRQCNDRKILFNNKTTSEKVKENQRTELLKQIDIVIAQNGGRPYSNELFREAQEWSSRHNDMAPKDMDSGGHSNEQIQNFLERMEKAQAEQLKKTTEMAEKKFHMTLKTFEDRLAAEHSAREQDEQEASEYIWKLEEQLQKAVQPRQMEGLQTAGQHRRRDGHICWRDCLIF